MLHDVEQTEGSADRLVFFKKWVSVISFGADVSSSDGSWTRLDISLCWLLFQLEKWPIAELPIWQWIFSSSSQMENEGDVHSSSSSRASEKLGFACFSPFYITVSWTPSEYLSVGQKRPWKLFNQLLMMNGQQISANVWTVCGYFTWAILVFLFMSLLFFHWFEAGGAQLEKSNVIY